MAHSDTREGKWRGNWQMEWLASTLHTTSDMVYPALLPLMCTPQLPVIDWTDAPANLNGLIRFAERRNLVSVHVASHLNWPLHSTFFRSLPLFLILVMVLSVCLTTTLLLMAACMSVLTWYTTIGWILHTNTHKKCLVWISTQDTEQSRSQDRW
jgi:hypothetical protein